MSLIKIVHDNLTRLLELDGRSVNKLASDAHVRWPERTASAWRSAFRRVFDGGWPEPDTLTTLAAMFGVSVADIVTAGSTQTGTNLPERPTAKTLIEFVVDVHGQQDAETRSVAGWLGLTAEQIEAMSWAAIERALDEAAREWSANSVSSGWGPA